MTADEVAEFQRLWGRLGRHGALPGETLISLLHRFADGVGLPVRQEAGDEAYAFVVVDAGETGVRQGQEALLFAVNDDDPARTHELYSQLIEQAYGRDVHATPAAVLNVRMSPLLCDRCLDSPVPFVLLDATHAGGILRSEGTRHRYAEVLLARSPVDVLNPFQYVGPLLRAEMFYGRHREIGLVSQPQAGNFALIGARKSGKTSFLFRLLEAARDPVPGQPARREGCYIDLAPYRTAAEAMFEIATRLQPQAQRRWNPSKFPHFLHDMAKGGREFLILLDECDRVIENDFQTGELLCKALAGTPRFRFVLAGHTQLLRSARNWQSTLWNSVKKLSLSELDVTAAQNLIHDPFVKLHFALPTGNEWRQWAAGQADERYRQAGHWIDYVVQEAGRRPALIQLYGHSLYSLARGQGRQSLQPDDLRVVDTTRLHAEVVESFIADTEPLTRLVGLLLLHAQSDELGEAELLAAVARYVPRVSLTQVQNALFELEHIGLVATAANRYRFAFGAFPRLLRQYHDVSLLVQEACREAGGVTRGAPA